MHGCQKLQMTPGLTRSATGCFTAVPWHHGAYICGCFVDCHESLHVKIIVMLVSIIPPEVRIGHAYTQGTVHGVTVCSFVLSFSAVDRDKRPVSNLSTVRCPQGGRIHQHSISTTKPQTIYGVRYDISTADRRAVVAQLKAVAHSEIKLK